MIDLRQEVESLVSMCRLLLQTPTPVNVAEVKRRLDNFQYNLDQQKDKRNG